MTKAKTARDRARPPYEIHLTEFDRPDYFSYRSLIFFHGGGFSLHGSRRPKTFRLNILVIVKPVHQTIRCRKKAVRKTIIHKSMR